jgi:hypothetical protein
MGRLENIIARNRRPNHLRERVLVSLVLGSIVLLIIVLAVFTDLGAPPDPRNAGRASATPAGAPGGAPAGSGDGKRVDGVLLRAMPAARPAPERLR